MLKAPLLNRFMASLLDTIIVLFAQFTFGASFNFINQFLYLPTTFVELGVLFFSLFFSLIVFIWPMVKKGMTPGKRLFNLKIVHFSDDQGLTFTGAILREFFAKLISLIFFPVTLLLFFFQKDGKLPHDFLCKTRVISDKNLS